MTSGVRRIVAVAVPLAVLVLLVGGAVLASRRGPEAYPEGTPEAAVQAYYQAIADDHLLDAYALLSPELQDQCEAPVGDETAYLSISRVVLDDVDTSAGKATVQVSVTVDYGGSPLSPDESTTDETVHLVDTGGTWRFSQLPSPGLVCSPKR